MKVIEFDVVFLSYDEPNADLHYADLCNKVPWAKRVHGVKGSDHAHKAAAEKSETEWFVTVDADILFSICAHMKTVTVIEDRLIFVGKTDIKIFL